MRRPSAKVQRTKTYPGRTVKHMVLERRNFRRPLRVARKTRPLKT